MFKESWASASKGGGCNAHFFMQIESPSVALSRYSNVTSIQFFMNIPLYRRRIIALTRFLFHS